MFRVVHNLDKNTAHMVLPLNSNRTLIFIHSLSEKESEAKYEIDQ